VTTNVSEEVMRYAERRVTSPCRLRQVPNELVLARDATDPATRERLHRALEVGAADFLWLFVGRLDVQRYRGKLVSGFAARRAAHPPSRLTLASAARAPLSMVAA
jgi:hypothetical protein